jgi:hypothetical protein
MEPEGLSPYTQEPTICFTIFCCVINLLRWGVCITSPKSLAEEPPLVVCPRLPIKHICSYPPYLQPEDATRRGDRDALITQYNSKNLKQRRFFCNSFRVTDKRLFFLNRGCHSLSSHFQLTAHLKRKTVDTIIHSLDWNILNVYIFFWIYAIYNAWIINLL